MASTDHQGVRAPFVPVPAVHDMKTQSNWMVQALGSGQSAFTPNKQILLLGGKKWTPNTQQMAVVARKGRRIRLRAARSRQPDGEVERAPVPRIHRKGDQELQFSQLAVRQRRFHLLQPQSP